MAITKAEWNEKRRQGKTLVREGQRYILMLDPETGATVLQPVTVRH